MRQRNIFCNISPLDHRYFLSNEKVFTELSRYVSEEASIRYCLRAEAALLKSHVDLFFGGDAEKKAIADAAADAVTPEEVYAEEEKTRHNIRALVHVFQRRLPEELRPYVHLGATSVDILDTAAAARMKEAVLRVILPLLEDVELLLCGLARDNAGVPQTGRTHGQHAVPITVGFTFAEYVARLGKSIREMETRARDLRGKLAGAVGAYNATSLLVKDPAALERRYLGYLHLQPPEYSNQMVEPEYQLRLLTEINTAFGILANLADDLRQLQRSEIGEVVEFFSADQVGSSTMPQKRNPWNSEHVKSLWKAFAPRVLTFYMDQISEHQRDLTNSASSRFSADFLAGFCAAAERMKRILGGLHVDTERCLQNIRMGGDSLLAEAMYILLAASGHPDGHEYIRRKTTRARGEEKSLETLLREDAGVWESITAELRKNYGMDAGELFSRPELYRGKAEERALELADTYGAEMRALNERLTAEAEAEENTRRKTDDEN
jgi:adenylosuccinate lyase